MGRYGGECGKTMELYENMNWRVDIGTYGGRTWQDIGDV